MSLMTGRGLISPFVSKSQNTQEATKFPCGKEVKKVRNQTGFTELWQNVKTWAHTATGCLFLRVNSTFSFRFLMDRLATLEPRMWLLRLFLFTLSCLNKDHANMKHRLNQGNFILRTDSVYLKKCAFLKERELDSGSHLLLFRRKFFCEGSRQRYFAKRRGTCCSRVSPFCQLRKHAPNFEVFFNVFGTSKTFQNTNYLIVITCGFEGSVIEKDVVLKLVPSALVTVKASDSTAMFSVWSWITSFRARLSTALINLKNTNFSLIFELSTSFLF